MSSGKRTKGERRRENYDMALKFGIALIVMIILVSIAALITHFQG
ncbi:MAG: hypothetical protein VB112_01515 [Oscillospiraceae bacterium]|nr:hypothetical protein [Oscillospiraceae bacterium]